MIKKFTTFLFAVLVVIAMSVTALATSESTVATVYKAGDTVTISGTTNFEDQHTYTVSSSTVYKCFTVSQDSQKWYAATSEDLFPYFQTAFTDKFVTIAGTYSGNFEDGTPVIYIGDATITVDDASYNIRDYIWKTLYAESPDFYALKALYASNYITEIGSDGSYIKVDTNPSNLGYSDVGKAIALVSNYSGFEYVKKLNSSLGLPSWLSEEMGATRAIDGRQHQEFDHISVSWSYLPRQGLEVIYRTK